MRTRLVKLGGLGLLFVFVFVLGLLLTFPSTMLSRIAEAQLEKATKFTYDIEIESARFAFPVGLALSDVSIVERKPDGPPRLTPEGSEELVARAIPLRIDRLTVTANPLTLPRAASGGIPSARGEARIGEGRVVVRVGPGEEEFADITLQLYDVELREIPQIAATTGVPVRGTANGTVALSYDEERKLAGGDIELSVSDTWFGPATVMQGKVDALPGGIPLVETNAGTILVLAQIDGSSMRLGTLEASGQDLRFDASGQIELRSPLSESLLTVPLEFGLDSAYVERSGFGPILGMIPELSRAQVGDGYALTLSGRFGRMRATPGARR